MTRGIGESNVETDIAAGGDAARAAKPNQVLGGHADRSELEWVLIFLALESVVRHAYGRAPADVACKDRREHRHPELVGAGLDRGAIGECEALHEGSQRRDVAQVQTGRAGVVLAEDDPIDPALGGELQCVFVDIPVARARCEISVERRATDSFAQTRRVGPLFAGLGWIGQIRILRNEFDRVAGRVII